MKIVNNFKELMTFLEKECGIKPGDTINLDSSPTKRTYDVNIKYIPETIEELDEVINKAPRDILKKMGVGIFNSYDAIVKEKRIPPRHLAEKGSVHYLYPGEWYNFLPDGIKVVDIFGKVEKFIKGESDDDIRFGCLPYGFIRIEK